VAWANTTKVFFPVIESDVLALLSDVANVLAEFGTRTLSKAAIVSQGQIPEKNINTSSINDGVVDLKFDQNTPARSFADGELVGQLGWPHGIQISERDGL
jgi:hypothetical protein